MSNQTKNSKITKTTIAAAVLATTVAPYAASATGETIVSMTPAEITTDVSKLVPAGTQAYVDAADKLVKAFDALTTVQQSQVKNAARIAINHHRNAIEVVRLILALPDTATIDTADATKISEYKQQIATIKTKHSALATTARTYVKNYTTVTTVETAVNNRATYVNNEVVLKPWIDAVAALPGKTLDLADVSAEDFKGYTDANKYTSTDLNNIAAARTAYTGLSSTLKKVVSTTDLNTLAGHEAQAKLQATLQTTLDKAVITDFTSLVTALNPSATTYVAAVDNMNAELLKLSITAQASLSNATKVSITHHTNAAAVVKRINEVTTVAAIESADTATLATITTNVGAVRTAYTTLATTARSYVKNLATLTGYEAAITARKNALENAEDLSPWNTAYASVVALGTPKSFEGVTVDNFGTASRYDSEGLKKIVAAREAYNDLSAMLKKYVPASHVENLLAHEAAKVQQETLQTAWDAAEESRKDEEAAVKEAEEALTAKVTAWNTKADTLPAAVITFADNLDLAGYKALVDGTGKYSSGQLTAIQEVRAAYQALAPDVIAKITTLQNQLQLLVNHEKAALVQAGWEAQVTAEKNQALQTAKSDFEALVTALDSVAAADYKTEVGKVTTAKGALSEDVLGLVSANSLTSLSNHEKAADVVAAIITAGTETAITDIVDTSDTAQNDLNTIKSKVVDARTAYGQLSGPQKTLVKNYSTLTALESAITTKQTAISKVVATKTFKDEMAKLPQTAHSFAGLTYENTVAEATKYDTVAAGAIGAADSAYEALANEYKTDSQISDLKTLLDQHKTALETQVTLLNEITAYADAGAALKTFTDALAAITFDAVSFEGIQELIEPKPEVGVINEEGYQAAVPGTPVYNEGQQGLIDTANRAYVALGEKNSYVTTTDKTKYDLYWNSLSKQRDLEVVLKEGKISALNSKISGWAIKKSDDLTIFAEDVKAANDTYTAFTGEEKAEILPANVTKLDDYVTAMVIIKGILDLPEVTADTTVDELTTYIQDAEQLVADYNLLGLSQRLLVVNYSDLPAYITSTKQAKTNLEIATALKSWNDAYNGDITDPDNIVIGIKGLDPTITFDEEAFDYNDTGLVYYTPEELTAITTARSAYDGLGNYKANVVPAEYQLLEKLEGIVKKYEELKLAQDAEQQAITDALADFTAAMKNLIGDDAENPTVPVKAFSVKADYANLAALQAANYSTTNLGLITTAIEAYGDIDPKYAAHAEAQYTDDLKPYVDSIADYNSIETAFNNEAAVTAALKPWTDAIGAVKALTAKAYVNTADALDAMDSINKDNVDTNVENKDYTPYLEEEIGKITKAREELGKLDLAHEELGDLRPNLVQADITVLTNYENALAAYTTAKTAKINFEKGQKKQELANKINTLDSTAASYVTDVTETNLLYLALTPEVRVEFDTEDATKVSATKFKDHQVVVNLVVSVGAIGTKAAIEAITTLEALLVIEGKISSADTAYKALSDGQKALYAKTTLEELDTAAKAKRTVLENAAKIASWTAKYADLPPVYDFTGVTADQLDQVATYTGVQITVIEELRAIYDGYLELEGDIQKLVPTAQYNQLVAVEAALEAQQGLENEKQETAEETAAAPKLTAWETAYGKLDFAALDFKNVTVLTFKDATVYTPEQLGLIDAASTAYNEIEEAHRKFADASKVANLEKHVKAKADQLALQLLFDEKLEADEKTEKLTDFVAALSTVNPSASTYVADVETLTGYYDALTEELLVKVTNAQRISYNHHKNAAGVVKAINEASDAERLTAATTLELLTAIENELNTAKTAYGALATTARTYVKNYATIGATLTTVTAKKTALQNATAIGGWTQLYGNLPILLDFSAETYATIGSAVTYNETDIKKVTDLRAIYDAYTSTVKGYVPTEQYNKLVAYENAIARQQLLEKQATTADTDLAKLEDWNAALVDFPTAIDVSGLTKENYGQFTGYGDEIKAQVSAAREAYDSLDESAKGYVVEADLNTLVAVEKSLVIIEKVKAEYNAIKAVDDSAPIITDITNLTLTSENYLEEIETVKAAFDLLSAEAKAKISNALKIKLTNYASAANVITLISELPAAEEIFKPEVTAEGLAPIKIKAGEASDAYAGLGTTARSYVNNLATLTAVEAAIKNQESYITNNGFVITFKEALTALPTYVDLSTVTEYTEAYDGDKKELIITARNKYNGLSSAAKTIVDAKDVELLEKYEAAVKKQDELLVQSYAKTASDLMTKVGALNPSDIEAYISAVTEIKGTYTTLAPEALAKLSNANKIAINHHINAVKVVEDIAAITLVDGTETEEVIENYKQAVSAARTAYAALATTARSHVKNLSVLAEHEALVKLL